MTTADTFGTGAAVTAELEAHLRRLWRPDVEALAPPPPELHLPTTGDLTDADNAVPTATEGAPGAR